MLTFGFKPTKEDYLRAYATYYLSNWMVYVPVIGIMLGSLACVGLGVFALLTNNSGRSVFDNPGVLLPMIFALFFFILLFSLFVMSPLRVAEKVEKDERLSSPVEYEITTGKITFRTKFIETTLDWGSFNKVIESKYMFLLLYTANKNMFQLIPKRAFLTEDEDDFRNLLNTKIRDIKLYDTDVKIPSMNATFVQSYIIYGLVLVAIIVIIITQLKSQ